MDEGRRVRDSGKLRFVERTDFHKNAHTRYERAGSALKRVKAAVATSLKLRNEGKREEERERRRAKKERGGERKGKEIYEILRARQNGTCSSAYRVNGGFH